MGSSAADVPAVHAWPRWMAAGSAVLALVFAVITVVMPPGLTDPLGLGLLGVALLAWLPQLFMAPLRRLWLALWAFPPLAALNIAALAGMLDRRPDEPDVAQFSLMLLILLVGELAMASSVRLSLPFTVGAIVIGLLRTSEHPAHFGYVMGMGFALVCGLLLRRQQGMLSQLRRAQAALAREAAMEERQRIAREVHDLVAHSLTVTMLHLSAARMALARSPAQAADALAEAERLGRQSLADIRRTVGLLRSGGSEGEEGLEPALPGAADIPVLIDDYAHAGLAVDGRVSGDLDRLPAALSLTVYRVVQEALANVVKHAPGARVHVLVEVAEEATRVEVGDDGGRAGGSGRSRGSGHGLRGMRERVESLDGTLSAGPAEGGWVVACRIPLPPPGEASTMPASAASERR